MYFLTLKSADPKHALVAFYLFLACACSLGSTSPRTVPRARHPIVAFSCCPAACLSPYGWHSWTRCLLVHRALAVGSPLNAPTTDTLLSGWEALTSLIFVLPALFIGAKTIVSMACCYYCYAIYKAKKDSVPYTAQHDEFESEAAA